MFNRMKWLLVIVIVLLMAACGSKSGKKGDGNIDTTPVTLKYYNYGMLTDELFEQFFITPVKAKYPHITLEMVNRSALPPAELAVGGNELDIISGWGSLFYQFGDFDLLVDLNPMVKKNNIDLNRFDKENLDGVKIGSELVKPGSFLGLPFGYNYYATFYNKNIFDKFGVDYPKDGMTWEDAIALATRLSRKEGDIIYKGLDPEGIEKVGSSLSLSFIEPIKEVATMDNEGWRRVFELVKRIHDIPNNDFSITSHGGTVNRFVKDQNVAMLAAPEVVQSLGEAPFDWDIAEYPSFPEQMHVSGMIQTMVLSLSKTSKYPEQTMLVLKTAISDEVQMALSKSGIMLSPMKNEQIQKGFAQEHPLLKNKNIEAILKTKPAPLVTHSRLGNGRSILEKYYKQYVAGEVDLNTALRLAQEEAESYIAEEKAKR